MKNEIIIKDSCDAIDELHASIACLDVLSLAVSSMKIEYGRAKEGVTLSLDDIANRLSYIIVYLEK